MKQLKLVIFDMDGLLFDTELPTYLAMKEIMESEGYDFLLDQYRQLIGLTADKANLILSNLFGENFHYEPFSAAYRKRFHEMLEKDGLMVKHLNFYEL